MIGPQVEKEVRKLSENAAVAKGNELKLVVFSLGESLFGVDVKNVREITNMHRVTEVPGAPELVEGIINLRGYIIPIFNLRKKLGIGDTEIQSVEEDGVKKSKQKIVILEVDNETVGIFVDSVNEVMRVDENSVEQPSGMVSGLNTDYVEGVVKSEKGLITILDIKKAVSLTPAA